AAYPHCRRAASAPSRARRQEGDAGHPGLASRAVVFARADVERSGLPLARRRAGRRSRRRRAAVDRGPGKGCLGRALRRGCDSRCRRLRGLFRAEAACARSERARQRVAARRLEEKGRRGAGGEGRPPPHDTPGGPRRTPHHRGAGLPMRTIAVVGMLPLVATAAAHPQGRPTLAFRGDAGFVWVRNDTTAAGAAGPVRLRGPMFGGEGRVVFNGFSLGLGLASGTLQTADQTVKRDLIEGRLVVAARPAPWLEMSVGPFVRAYVTVCVTECWVFWQARARVEAPIVTASLTSYVELWRGVVSGVNFVGGGGAGAGVVLGRQFGGGRRPGAGRRGGRGVSAAAAAVLAAPVLSAGGGRGGRARAG